MSGLKNNIRDCLEENGALKQHELKKKLWENYDNNYKNKQVLAVTLSNIKNEMENQGIISLEEEDADSGSLTTDIWRLVE